MANRARRLPANADGDLYVDDTCIDCDTCRWMAPATFDRIDAQSRVHTQPTDPATRQRAHMALLACPTASIGTVRKADLSAARAAFPDPIDAHGDLAVFHCGYHAEASFGATSYLLRRPNGNVLVDSPRYTRALADRLDAMGGVALLFLTHRDDVADHERWVHRYGCERVMHAADAGRLAIERRIDGLEPVALDADLTVIPVPGHTRGSACLLVRERWLFTGDHLAWSEPRGHLYAFRGACWYDWDAQIASMERLSAHRFAWVLPGHGRRAHLDPDAMPAAIARCVTWMRG